MKIVFLDVDGVLNNEAFANQMLKETGIDIYQEDKLYWKSIQLLKQLIDNTGAQIVLSSDWRYYPEAIEHLKEQLNRCELQIFDVTPTSNAKQTRYQEIQTWLNNHNDVESFAILDDYDDELSNFGEHFIYINPYHGLQESNIYKAQKTLEE